MKLAEWARANGVHPQPAYRWFRWGIMPDLEHRHHWPASAARTTRMGVRPMREVPDGWVARGFVFEVETTSLAQPTQVAQAFGARRYAYNWAPGQVKANLDARGADPTVPPLAWSFSSFARRGTRPSTMSLPGGLLQSKEAYASGIADLVAGLHNWSDAKAGRRKGSQVGFPRFKARHRDRGRVRFNTGAMRLEPDRRHLTVPVIGKLRARRTPAGWSGWSSMAGRASCR